MFLRSILAVILIAPLLFLVEKAHSQEIQTDSYITIVNPVRVSSYTKNSSESISAQYEQVHERNLPATWLITYDVLDNKDAVDKIKEFNEKQEVGIFMEISSHSAKLAGIPYNHKDSWHRASSLFLSGYRIDDRRKFIDSFFERFKSEFGYYPKSTGGWWIESSSLDYMEKKYKISATINVSDQIGTDGYNIWGTYWSSPYYPSKNHAGIPASHKDNKLDVVTIRWAPRDPLNGYEGANKISGTLYSTQDYNSINLPDSYFESLVDLYLKEVGQVTIGLEGDFNPDAYAQTFRKHISYAETQNLERNVIPLTMTEYAEIYRKKNPNLSPPVLIESWDLLGTGKKVFWFQNPNYRIGIVHDPIKNSTEIIDLRSYYNNFYDPFNINQNFQNDFFAILPPIIDSSYYKHQGITLDPGKLLEVKKDNILIFEKGRIVFEEKGIEVDVPFDNAKNSVINDGRINLTKDYSAPIDGYQFKDMTPIIPFALKSRAYPINLHLVLASLLVVGIVSFMLIYKFNKVIGYSIIVIIIACVIIYGLVSYKKTFYLSQSEIDSLNFMRSLKDGIVLLFDKDCIKCDWKSFHKPGVFEGRKDYVRKLSGKKIHYSLDFVMAKTPQEANKVLKNKGIRYIYLVKYDSYVEQLSFSPESIGVRKIFENANSLIFEVL